MVRFGYFVLFVTVFSLFFFPTMLYAQSTTPWSFYNNPNSSNALDIFYNGVGAANPAIRITPGGNIGIGATSPGQKLQVGKASGGASEGVIRTSTNNNAGGSREWDFGAGLTAFGNWGFNIKDTGMSAPALTVAFSTGNVGIGTISPAFKTQIDLANALGSSNALFDGLLIRTYNQASGVELRHGSATGFMAMNPDAAGSGALGIGTKGAFPIYFYTNAGLNAGTASTTGIAMTVLSNGNVGIGSTAPGSKLYVNGTTRIEGAMGINGYNPGNCNAGPPAGTYGLCLGGSGYAQVSWSQGSDIRFKKEIQPLHNSLQKILALEGVSFKYDRTLPNGDKYPDTTQIGFIAQQVEPIVPEVVTTTPEGYKAMSYGNLTSLLTEAIKEQQIQIERLKFSDEQMSDEIKQLKNEIENMKQELKVLKSQ